MKPTISVIIPVYKAEKHLSGCIESVINQTFVNWELILIDDGSPDESGVICDDFASKDSRIKAIHIENGGVSAARNLGLKTAVGEYVTFIDSDDYIDKTFFMAALEVLKESNSDVYLSGIVEEFWASHTLVTKRAYTNKFLQKTYNAKELLEAHRHDFPTICISGPWCKLYKRELIVENAIAFPPELKRGEDALFNLMVINFCDSFVFDNNIYYHYRRENTDSLYSKYCPELFDIHRELYQYKKTLIEVKGCSDKVCDEYKRFYVYDLMACISHFFKFHRNNTRQERMDIIKRVAKDECLKKLHLSLFSGKDYLVLLLLKNKWYHLLYFIYYVRYIAKNKQ